MAGDWSWQGNGKPNNVSLPDNVIGQNQSTAIAYNECRQGMRKARVLPRPKLPPQSKVLVLGSGEFVWHPYELALALEQEGHDVVYGSISRSPVSIGMAMKSGFSLHDNYGEEFGMYVYNVDPKAYDKIFVCSETAAENWDKNFLAQLGNVEVITHVE